MNKFFGKETVSAINNFQISNYKLQQEFIDSVVEIKKAAAIVNIKLGNIDIKKGEKIINTCDILLKKFNSDLFPVDVFQTGSGTSTNMNVNEVISKMSSLKGLEIHPNDHVNWGQSSNCVIPSAINISNRLLIEKLIENLIALKDTITIFAKENKNIIKIGRTHLQDAVPMTIVQEFLAYANLINQNIKRMENVKKELEYLPIGGTAIGTGIASHPKFSSEITKELSKRFNISFKVSKNNFSAISTREEQVSLMSSMATLASTLLKISNDLRLLSSGPGTGINEISFKKLQAGSSVMPGKINPVIAEMMIQVCAYIIGNSNTVNIANQNGPLQLNMMMPLIAFISIDSIKIFSNAISKFTELGIKNIKVNKDVINKYLYNSSAIITVLKNHPKVGYDLATQIVKESKEKNKSVIEIVKDKKIFSEKEINKIFNFKKMV